MLQPGADDEDSLQSTRLILNRARENSDPFVGHARADHFADRETLAI
jgi:hypothetical protein